MKKGKLVLREDGIRQMMLSDEIKEACLKEAQKIQQSAGDGYKVDSYVGKNRVNASVHPCTPETARDTLQNNTLVKIADSHRK